MNERKKKQIATTRPVLLNSYGYRQFTLYTHTNARIWFQSYHIQINQEKETLKEIEITHSLWVKKKCNTTTSAAGAATTTKREEREKIVLIARAISTQ